MKPYKELQAFIDDLDNTAFDVEAIQIDANNRNFSIDDVENYRHENIVRASLVNGQFTQAREQCRAYGLDYKEELYLFKYQNIKNL